MSKSITYTIAAVVPLLLVQAASAKTINLADGLIEAAGSAIAQNNPACKKKITMKNLDVEEDLNIGNLASVDLSVVDSQRMCNAE
ncbi:hypothetical protein, partial [Pseudoalteromonas sp. MMG012]|uniref:hypothetical protein n=1 Tax=Pseudoalteromonas sp. MMG012 TaxID=2822686 RepID=UPI001B3A1FF5